MRQLFDAEAVTQMETWKDPCASPFYFAAGLERQPTVATVEAFLPSSACVEYIPAYATSAVRVEELISAGLVEAAAFGETEGRMAKFGLSGRSQQDAFTVACAFTHRRFWEMMVARGIEKAVIFESDAVYVGDAASADRAVDEVLRAATATDPDWELINLGRCWDLCELDERMAPLRLHANASLVRSVSMGCTHAYAVTLTGAKKLLSLSLPHLTSVDYLVALLSRTGLLRAYASTPRLFDQRRERTAHDSSALPECDPSAAATIEKFTQRPAAHASVGEFLQKTRGADMALATKGNHEWIRQWSPAARDCPQRHGVSALAEPAAGGAQCQLRQYCRVLGGHGTPSRAHSASSRLLAGMDALGLRGAVVWDLSVDEEAHTHAYVHEALVANLAEAFANASRPMHLCWVPSSAFDGGCSLGAALGDDSSVLAHSLVLASPKHMAWSEDPSLAKLPVDARSAYIFHDTIPPPFEPLKKLGRALEWSVFGPDGNFAFTDSLSFAHSSLSLPGQHGSRCPSLTCTDVASRAYVSPWATPLPPAQIDAAAKLARAPSDDVHFVGSVWSGNARHFSAFASGCRAEGVRLVRHGARALPPHIAALVAEDDVREVPSAERDALIRASPFAVAVQGDAHLRGEQSYIADRALLAASLGQLVVTNNPAVVTLLKDFPSMVVYSANATELCGMAHAKAHALAKQQATREQQSHEMAAFVREHHTYLSRLADMTEMLRSATASAAGDARVGGAAEDQAWCKGSARWSGILSSD